MRNVISTTIITAMLAFAMPVFALSATQTVEKETVVQLPDGTESITRVSADTVTPGERIVLSLIHI